jgi:hypothetical protein
MEDGHTKIKPRIAYESYKEPATFRSTELYSFQKFLQIMTTKRILSILNTFLKEKGMCRLGTPLKHRAIHKIMTLSSKIR